MFIRVIRGPLFVFIRVIRGQKHLIRVHSCNSWTKIISFVDQKSSYSWIVLTDLIYKQEAYEIIGAAMEVHNELGCGFLEAVYQEAFECELKEKLVDYQREKLLSIYYKGKILNKLYSADFVCYDKIIVELKALSALTSEHDAQILNYLKATGIKLGILINFGTKSLQYKRIVL